MHCQFTKRIQILAVLFLLEAASFLNSCKPFASKKHEAESNVKDRGQEQIEYPAAFEHPGFFEGLVGFALGTLKQFPDEKTHFVLLGVTQVVTQSVFRVLKVPESQYSVVALSNLGALADQECDKKIYDIIGLDLQVPRDSKVVVFVRNLYFALTVFNVLKYYNIWLSRNFDNLKIFGRFTVESKTDYAYQGLPNSFQDFEAKFPLDLASSIELGHIFNRDIMR